MIVENKAKIAKGSKILIETLKSLGVDTIFGYPGGIVLKRTWKAVFCKMRIPSWFSATKS